MFEVVVASPGPDQHPSFAAQSLDHFPTAHSTIMRIMHTNINLPKQVTEAPAALKGRRFASIRAKLRPIRASAIPPLTSHCERNEVASRGRPFIAER
jgi:hypothetical protein